MARESGEITEQVRANGVVLVCLAWHANCPELSGTAAETAKPTCGSGACDYPRGIGDGPCAEITADGGFAVARHNRKRSRLLDNTWGHNNNCGVIARTESRTRIKWAHTVIRQREWQLLATRMDTTRRGSDA
jgi:hypothetical protein